MKFLCLAYEAQRDLDVLTPEEWSELRRETLEYVDSLRERGRLVAANALKSARTASVVRVRGGEISVTDGPYAETKEQIGGFFLIEAEDFDAAIRIAANWPSARFGSIEVRPVEEVLREDRRYEASDDGITNRE